MKKKLLIALSVVMAVSLAVGSTLAYMTDKESVRNVLTMGNVNIEYEETFELDGPIFPGVTVAKYGTVTNVGVNDAYVWVSYLVPSAIADYVNVIVDESELDKDWDYKGAIGTVVRGETEYTVYTSLSLDVFAPGDSSWTDFYGVQLDSRIDYNEDDGKYYIVENGTATEIAMDISDFDIYCEAYAFQTVGFADAQAAYDTFMEEQWGHEHFDTADLIYANTQADLEAAVAAGNSVVLASGEYELPTNIADGATISGSGNTVLDTSKITGTLNVTDLKLENIKIVSEDTEALPISGSATITNCELYSERGPVLYNSYADGDIVFDGCTISSATYAINIVGSGSVTIKNSTIAGWCSFGGGVDVTIDNCAFEKCELTPENSVLRFYADAMITNTTFAPEMWVEAPLASSDVTITLIGCSVTDGSAINDILDDSNENGKVVTFVVG